MRKLLCLFLLATPLLADVKFVDDKRTAVATIDRHAAEMTKLSDEVWRYAETALRETRSSKALADYAESKGFRVTRNVAAMPTAFVAEFGSGVPVIGIMGEYDALPGISQKAQPTKDPLVAGAPGHGCGHNLFGVGSLGAAIAIKELIADGRLKGTIKFFGTPAEEAVGGKIYMLRDGVFRDVDVMLAWHPSDETQSDTKSSQALVDLIVEFKGRASHAAFDPWNGRSAVDGLELFTHGINLMREHIRPTSRMHYAILEAGKVPNVVPDTAKIWIWLRDNERTEVDRLLGRLRQIAQGAALAADVESTVTVQGGDWNMLVNMTGQRAAWENMNWLGPLAFTNEEQQFAKTIQKETGVAEKGLLGNVKPFEANPGPPEGGSTDVADVSWNIPTIHLSVTTAPTGAPWHGWPVVACGGMSIGHKGMLWASKALAATMIDYYRDPKLLQSVKTEFAKSTEGITYKPYIPAGPPPVPSN
ncbi:MAG TPA: amidohydrolase [Thermoanaerobaculia bacterium]|nr:amidohydrolase [Thermoanaerobaculia bacterium]